MKTSLQCLLKTCSQSWTLMKVGNWARRSSNLPFCSWESSRVCPLWQVWYHSMNGDLGCRKIAHICASTGEVLSSCINKEPGLSLTLEVYARCFFASVCSSECLSQDLTVNGMVQQLQRQMTWSQSWWKSLVRERRSWGRPNLQLSCKKFFRIWLTFSRRTLSRLFGMPNCWMAHTCVRCAIQSYFLGLA